MKQIIGIDIGGTKISVCIGNDRGNISIKDKLQTKDFKDSKQAVDAIFKSIEGLLSNINLSIDKISAIGISCPGPISHKKGLMIAPPNLKGWENTPIVKLFQDRFKKPIFMDNDANAAALAEYDFGKHKNSANLVYLTASTGMGGGIIVDHQLVRGISDTAGEVGHFVLDINGPKCPCGQRGCFEVYCGGKNLADKIKNDIKNKNVTTKILDEVSGEIEKVDMIAFIEAVKKKDIYALKIFDEFVSRLAQGIGIIMMVLNPDVIILGTIATHSKEVLFPLLKKTLPQYVWPMAIEKSIIVPSEIKENLSELSSLGVAVYGLSN